MGITARVSLARARDVTLGTFFERFAHTRANRLLVEQPDGLRLTYAEAAELVARAAGTVRTKIEPGDRVVVALPNGYPLLLACLAVCRAGGVAVPVNERMAAPELDYVEQDANAVWRIDDFDALTDAPPTDAVPVDTDAVALLLYTSGTTGKPKGARLTHKSLVGGMSAGALVPEALLEHGCVTGMPVAHIAGLQALLGLAAAGIPVYLLTHFRPTDALDAIEQRRPMMFLGVPAMYRMMLEAGAADRDLSSVRMWSSGADTLPSDIVDAFQRMGRGIPVPFTQHGIGRATFVDGYGMVELAGGVAVRVFAPIPIPGVRGLLRPMQGHDVRIVDDNGNDVGRGEVGELLVRGPGVMRGYHGRDDATAATMTDGGWLRTGDLARPRHFGFFELAGRKKDVIKHGGYSVFAVEVERTLEEHSAVAEAAVLPLPDSSKGEVPVAAVRLRPEVSATPEELRAHCAARLSDYKVPRQIVLVDELPRTGTEKVQKRDLVPLFDER